MHPVAELGLDLVLIREDRRQRLPHWDPRLWQSADVLECSRVVSNARLRELGLSWAKQRRKTHPLATTSQFATTRPSHGRPEGARENARTSEAPEDGRKGGAGRAQAQRAEHGTGWAAGTGKEEDVEVGLQYFGKRLLSPYLGRWVSADPLGVHVPGKADLNLYAYVSGRPLLDVDPLGLDGIQQMWTAYDWLKDQRIGPVFYRNKRELGMSLTTVIARGPLKSGCATAPSICGGLARTEQRFEELVKGEGSRWQSKLLGEYLRGGDPNRTLKLSVAEARDWVARGEVTPYRSKAFTETVDRLAEESLKAGGKPVTGKFLGTSTDSHFNGPGHFTTEWNLDVTVSAGKSSDGKPTGRRLTYSGTLRLSDRFDFDPNPLREPNDRSDLGEWQTRVGEALPGTPFNISSGELDVSGEGAHGVKISGEKPAAPTVDKSKQ